MCTHACTCVYTRKMKREREREGEGEREGGEGEREAGSYLFCVQLILAILLCRWPREKGKNIPNENTKRKRSITLLIAHRHAAKNHLHLVTEDTPLLPHPLTEDILLPITEDTPLLPHLLTASISTSLEQETRHQLTQSRGQPLPINRKGDVCFIMLFSYMYM